MTTRLILVRHGESIAQAEGYIGGPKGCRGLSEVGRQQVESLRDRWVSLGGIEADILLSSTLPRAVETAEILLPALGALIIEQLEELCEILPGECDGMRWTEFEERFRGGDYRWDPYTALAPGGESWFEFQTRVSKAIGEIVERHEGQTVVAAVHGGVIDGSMVHFLGLPKDAGNVLESINASVTEWKLTDRGWRLVRFNDHAHLEGR